MQEGMVEGCVVVVCCSVLQCVAVCCDVFQSVAVCRKRERQKVEAGEHAH